MMWSVFEWLKAMLKPLFRLIFAVRPQGLEVLVARLAVHLATAADVRHGLLQLGDAVAGAAQDLLGPMGWDRMGMG